MTRFDDPLFDPRLAEWLEEDPNAAPDQALDVVLASFPSINQRRAVRVLSPHGLRPPNFRDYSAAMVRFFREHEDDPAFLPKDD